MYHEEIIMLTLEVMPSMATQDRISMHEAAALLGVSHSKMWQLVKGGELSAEPNPLDRRQKLVRLEDVMKIKGESRPSGRFFSDGAGTNPEGPDAATVKDWIRKTWHRES
jgi:hypothetical protein